MLRARPVCAACGRRRSDSVDHVQAIRLGGAPFDTANLRALCRPCHSAKTAAGPERRPGAAGLWRVDPATGLRHRG